MASQSEFLPQPIKRRCEAKIGTTSERCKDDVDYLVTVHPSDYVTATYRLCDKHALLYGVYAKSINQSADKLLEKYLIQKLGCEKATTL